MVKFAISLDSLFWDSLKSRFKSKKSKQYKLILNSDYSEWQKYFLAVNKGNVLQSWSYGLGKAASEKWKVSNGIIFHSDEPIAIFQALEKSFFFIKIARINLGPLWLIDPSEEQIKQVFFLIKSKFSLKTMKMLLIAPNLLDSELHRKLLHEVGFYKNKFRFYQLESGIIDLSQSEESLFNGLRSNWRRQLKSAEKKELKFIKSSHPDDFNWLMSKYELFQNNKNFQGTPIHLLRELFKLNKDSNEIWVFISLHDEERVGGLLVLNYYTGCIPIVSWLSEKGRLFNAGNFTLWNAVLYAKNQGCRWFEQGGMDSSDAPISKFKRGIPCEPYKMIGEYISF